jgi:hypothetical protein
MTKTKLDKSSYEGTYRNVEFSVYDTGQPACGRVRWLRCYGRLVV